MNIIINSENRIDKNKSANDAEFLFDWGSILTEGKYKISWKLTKILKKNSNESETQPEGEVEEPQPEPEEPEVEPEEPEETVPPTPVFYYSFNMSLLYDEATNREDGNNYGAVLDNDVFIRGVGSSKFIGDNSTSYVSTPSFPILGDTGITFSVWFKIPQGTLEGFTPIFSNNNGGSPNFTFGQDYQNENCMFFYSTNAGNSGLINVFYLTPVFDDTWHHTVISISSDNKTLRWFLDGVQIEYSNRQPNSDPSVYPQNKQFQMGSAYKFTGSYNLDNFIFYDRELSSDEAIQLYNS